MTRLFYYFLFTMISLSFFNHNTSFAIDLQGDEIDIVKTTSSSSKLDVRDLYNNEIIEQALSHSVDKYGSYKIIKKPISMINTTNFYELSRGKVINLVMSAATPDKDHLAIPIRIPIRRGILNYRLLVVNKDKVDLFKKVTTRSQLESFTAGIHSNSATGEVMDILGFNIIERSSYDGMFKQLSLGRFDYIPRGVHEAYDELELRKGTIDNLVIEPNLAIYMPMPYYIYVSPAFPRLAERLEYGLEKMIESQQIKKIFNRYYGADIERANLAKRTIIDIGNPFLSPKTPFSRKELWIDEYAIKTPKTSVTYSQQ